MPPSCNKSPLMVFNYSEHPIKYLYETSQPRRPSKHRNTRPLKSNKMNQPVRASSSETTQHSNIVYLVYLSISRSLSDNQIDPTTTRTEQHPIDVYDDHFIDERVTKDGRRQHPIFTGRRQLDREEFEFHITIKLP